LKPQGSSASGDKWNRAFDDIPAGNESASAFGSGQVAADDPPQRRIPWIIDIFLYPLNGSGIVNLVMFSALLFFAGFLFYLGLCITIILGLMLSIISSVYFFNYLLECIRGSSLGNIRAAENIDRVPELGEACMKIVEILGILGLLWAPFVIYFAVVRQMDPLAYVFATYGIFVNPIAFLALALFQSTSAFNPIIWFESIGAAFVPYLGLFLLLAGIAFLVDLMSILFFPIAMYMMMVEAHLLGRFYYRYSEKLNWAV